MSLNSISDKPPKGVFLEWTLLCNYASFSEAPSIISGLLAAADPAKEALAQAAAIEQADAMRIALITIAALAAANVLLVILMVAGRKKKAD